MGGGYAFSHNPDDLVDWIWVVLSYGVVAAIVALLGVVVYRLVRGVRSSARAEGRDS